MNDHCKIYYNFYFMIVTKSVTIRTGLWYILKPSHWQFEQDCDKFLHMITSNATVHVLRNGRMHVYLSRLADQNGSSKSAAENSVFLKSKCGPFGAWWPAWCATDWGSKWRADGPGGSDLMTWSLSTQPMLITAEMFTSTDDNLVHITEWEHNITIITTSIIPVTITILVYYQ